VEKGKPLGFPQHTHANIEIIAYVRDGALSHRDSLGNQGRIRRWRCSGDERGRRNQAR
jgi:redox-sensitive bicupin YhaK (pirin superfamily)